MKATIKICLLLIGLAITSVGCKKINKSEDLRIDLISNFENDLVTIKLDQEEIFSKYVTTNSLDGFAEIIIVNIPKGRYQLTIKINSSEAETKFKHEAGRYIRICYENSSAEHDSEYGAITISSDILE